ncbi:hypothetical protein BDW59DRAFT_171925 [Aspergillus cavernicola]|uniref:Uncharacterized protein n=1 Tax=Aspergillus cavernicola TaxID=176166 RepID=A0ABR4IHE8_9EURO
MTSYDHPYGYALRRNGTCLTHEDSCGNTWSTWNVCCPEDTHCVGGQVCCPTDSDCSAPIDSDPHCADLSWDLYPEYFCCLKGTTGFSTSNLVYNGIRQGGVGCADRYPSGESNTVLVPVQYGHTTTTTPSTTTTTNALKSDIATPVSISETEPSSSINTGLIVGGIVSGVIGLALGLALKTMVMNPGENEPANKHGELYKAELDTNSTRAELDVKAARLAHELPAHSTPRGVGDSGGAIWL